MMRVQDPATVDRGVGQGVLQGRKTGDSSPQGAVRRHVIDPGRRCSAGLVEYVELVKQSDGTVARVQRRYKIELLEGDGVVLGPVEPREDERCG